MKKYFYPVILAIILLILSSCTGNNYLEDDSMTIKPSEFSDETNQILNLIDDEMAFFDYNIDETIKSISVELWMYENNTWQSIGKIYGNTDSNSGRLAIRINDASYDIFEIDENGHTKSSYESTVDFEKSNAITGTRLSNKTKIETDKEITLWTKLGSDDTSMISSSADFRHSECDTGLAVTVMFSDKPVE